MLKEFYKCLRTRINTSRKLGRQRDELVTWFEEERDCLTIYRSAPNSYLIIFESAAGEFKSWSHRDVPLRLVVLAIKSFDGMTDMFGQPFHNKKTHDFCY